MPLLRQFLSASGSGDWGGRGQEEAGLRPAALRMVCTRVSEECRVGRGGGWADSPWGLWNQLAWFKNPALNLVDVLLC